MPASTPAENDESFVANVSGPPAGVTAAIRRHATPGLAAMEHARVAREQARRELLDAQDALEALKEAGSTLAEAASAHVEVCKKAEIEARLVWARAFVVSLGERPALETFLQRANEAKTAATDEIAARAAARARLEQAEQARRAAQKSGFRP